MNSDGVVNDQDIKVIEIADDVQFNLKLSKAATSSSLFSTTMDADLGLPTLGLKVNGNAQVGIGLKG